MSDCQLCQGEGQIEEAVFGRFAPEASRPVPCPRCRHFLWEADQAAHNRALVVAAQNRRERRTA